MRITILQTDIEWSMPEKNALEAERMICETPGSDLYVLPEMWSTGFATMPQGIAEPDNRSLQWMLSMSKKTGAAISGTIAIDESSPNGHTYYNRHYLAKPDGTYDYYDKHHLFRYGGEDKHYVAGMKRTVSEWQGMRFLLLTCYDLRFPKWARYAGDYDAILVSANWPSSRQNVWHILLRARAIENQCFVIGCNRVGQDPYNHYLGMSAVIDPRGKSLCELTGHNAGSVTADIDLDDLKNFRDKFRVLDDRD